MKQTIYMGLVILCICSTIVFASNAPPALPMDVWGEATVDGAPAADGLAVTAEVGGVDYAQATVTSGGNYDVIIAGGDHELTTLADWDCAIAIAAGDACIPCETDPEHEDYCIEGPQDGDQIKLIVDSDEVMPTFGLLMGDAEEVDIVWPIGDWSVDGCTDMGDFVGPFADFYGICPCGNPIPLCRILDLNFDCMIDMGDFVGPFADNYGEGC